ncbi:MAG: DUF6817 domain-containing protein [Paraglaciecola sp.]|uniref:DUF6817 domain-containing protein n=1 Tax=Paraglaciecola sp. TaxID=1920173 RepID=UPI0032989258
MDINIRKLIELGAGKFEHLDSTLITHIESTRCRLKEWNADIPLQQAGLYYIAYLENEVNNSRAVAGLRNSVKEIVGTEVETIIYYYYAWDKVTFMHQPITSRECVFNNAITGTQESIPYLLFCQLCELYAAIAIDNIHVEETFSLEISSKYRRGLSSIMPYLSAPAKRKITIME